MSGNLILLTFGAIFSTCVIVAVIIANKSKHPKALFILFFTEMWERFSFYGMKALLVAYMSKVLLIDDEPVNLMYGAYMAMVYTFPIVGGYVADKLLGFRKTILLGGVLMAIGHLVLAIPSQDTFFLGLGFLIGGNGFFKPNISSFLGKFYKEKQELNDEAYSIFYMGINVGAFIGVLTCAYLGKQVNWHLGFGVAGIFMMLGLTVFLLNRGSLENLGYSPNPELLNKKLGNYFKIEWIIYLVAFLLIPVFVFLLKNYEILDYGFSFSFIAAIGILLYQSYLYKGEGGNNLLIATILIAFSSLFWAFYEQGGGALNFFAARNVNTLGMEPEMINNSLNPFYIILLSPIFGYYWTYLERKKAPWSFSTRFALGFILLGIGFYAFIIGAKLSDAEGMVGMGWFALGYLFISIGEMFLSPVGLAMVSKLSPPKIVGMVMGIWFLATGYGQFLAGKIGAMMAIPKNDAGEMLSGIERLAIYTNVFEKITIVSISFGIFIIILFYLKNTLHKRSK